MMSELSHSGEGTLPPKDVYYEVSFTFGLRLGYQGEMERVLWYLKWGGVVVFFTWLFWKC